VVELTGPTSIRMRQRQSGACSSFPQDFERLANTYLDEIQAKFS
jgi:hypothetical protein